MKSRVLYWNNTVTPEVWIDNTLRNTGWEYLQHTDYSTAVKHIKAATNISMAMRCKLVAAVVLMEYGTNVNFIEISANRGYASPVLGILRVKEPTTPMRLDTFIHEIGHAHLHFRGNRLANIPVYLQEYEAVTFTEGILYKFGITPNPDKAYINWAYVCDKVERARKRWCRVEKRVTDWIEANRQEREYYKNARTEKRRERAIRKVVKRYVQQDTQVIKKQTYYPLTLKLPYTLIKTWKQIVQTKAMPTMAVAQDSELNIDVVHSALVKAESATHSGKRGRPCKAMRYLQVNDYQTSMALRASLRANTPLMLAHGHTQDTINAVCELLPTA